MSVRTLFFGSGSVARPALDRLRASDLVTVVAVVTTPPRPAGRRQTLTATPIGEAAEAAGLPLLTPRSLRDEATLAELRSLAPELIVLADYGRLIPPDVLELPPHGALNIHPSLLPRHRGAAPVPATILAGDPVAGISLMRMDEGLDTGPLLAQVEVPLAGDEVAPELEQHLAEIGAELLIEHLPAWLDGSLVARPQAEDGVTLTRPLRREDGWLDPSRSARELERQVRAYQPWPGAFTEHDGTRLKVWSASVLERATSAQPGHFILADGTIGLGTRDGVLRLDEVQPAGRRRMSGEAYRRGKRL